MSSCSQGELCKILETESHFFSHLCYFVGLFLFLNSCLRLQFLIMILILVHSRRLRKRLTTEKLSSSSSKKSQNISFVAFIQISCYFEILHISSTFTSHHVKTVVLLVDKIDVKALFVNMSHFNEKALKPMPIGPKKKK